MPRGGGRSRGRRRSYSPIGIPGMRPGDSFGRRGGGGSSSSVSAAMTVLILFILLFGFTRMALSENAQSNVTSDIYEASEVQSNKLPQLEIYRDGWDSFTTCTRGYVKIEGSTGYGNVSMTMDKTSSHTYRFNVTANGFEPIFLDINFENNAYPAKDVVSYATFTKIDGQTIEIETQRWEYPEWENRTLIFRTSSGEVGTIILLDGFVLYGVMDEELLKYCEK